MAAFVTSVWTWIGPFSSASRFLLHRIGFARTAELLTYTNPAVVGLGFALGAAAMLSELPNSVLKRQLGIATGASGSGIVGSFFYVLDQIDMLVGLWVVLALVIGVTALRVLWSVVFLFTTHQMVTVVGYRLGIRVTPR
jgi:CDP-archaeol synthase